MTDWRGHRRGIASRTAAHFRARLHRQRRMHLRFLLTDLLRVCHGREGEENAERLHVGVLRRGIRRDVME